MQAIFTVLLFIFTFRLIIFVTVPNDYNTILYTYTYTSNDLYLLSLYIYSSSEC